MVIFAFASYCSGLALAWIIKLDPSRQYFCFLAAAFFGLGITSPTLDVGRSSLHIHTGDSTFNTQVYASLGTLFTENSVAAFTLFQFLQCLGAALGFFYSPLLPVHGEHGTIAQIAILAGVGLVSVISFLFVRLKAKAGVPIGH